ncbi:MAG: PEGA domain-containing protein [Myxococcota bacterium]|nr:PEGA domain-containing protein [Myxococcota bacterium]
MKSIIIQCALLFSATSVFANGPTIAIAPVQTDKSIPTAIAEEYDAKVRQIAAKSTQVVSKKKTGSALSKSGVSADCMTDKCGAGLAKAADARFALFTKVVNDDDIYKVSMTLYDAALKKRAGQSEEECELCAAREVNGTLAATFKSFSKAIAVPAPKVKEPKKTTGSGIQVRVTSEPKGAAVQVGGVKKGKTPVTFTVKPGTYTLTISKPGFLSVNRKISALSKKVNLKVKLKADPNSPLLAMTPAAVKPSTSKLDKNPKVEDISPKAKPETTAVNAPSVGSAYNGLALGMVLGGVALSGVGTWLVLLDGEVTCSDGRGRRECPYVYNTNGLGLLAFGLGTAAIGAGTALFIEDYVRMNRVGNQINVGAAPTDGGAFFQLSGQF